MHTQKEYRICKTCGRRFMPSSRHKDCPRCRYHLRKSPCPICGRLSSPDYILCKECSRKQQHGEMNGNWKGGEVYETKGYKMIWSPLHPKAENRKSKYIFEHTLIMEQHIGRYLKDKEHVHHKNGIKRDNRIENLELWTGNHPTGSRVVDLLEWARSFIKEYG